MIFNICIYIIFLKFILLHSIHKVLRLLVASAEGYLYVYNLDSAEGGDCTLLKQHRFVFLHYDIFNLIYVSTILIFNYYLYYI